MSVSRRFADTDGIRMRVVEEGEVRDCPKPHGKEQARGELGLVRRQTARTVHHWSCTAITPTRVMTDDLGDAILK